MNKKEFSILRQLQNGLKLLRETDESSKQDGLNIIGDILNKKDVILTKLGHDLLIFKRLCHMITFDQGKTLEIATGILENHYFKDLRCQDELAQLLIMRAIQSTDYDTCRLCLEKISILTDHLDDRIGKHSKQILKLVDINYMPGLNDILCEILDKLKDRLPRRRNIAGVS